MAIRFKGIRLEDSPDDPAWVRVSGELTLDEKPPAQQLWIEVKREYADVLNLSGDPWLMALLAFAAETGQSLEIDAPVDRVLYENAHTLQRIWNTCGRTPKRLVPLSVAQLTDGQETPRPERTGLFFSGGVDSLYSLISDTAEHYPERSYRIDDLVHIWGYDLALDCGDAYRREDVVQQAIADATGRTLFRVRTNLRLVMFRGHSWGWVHPLFLVAAGLALSGRYRRILAAGDRDYAHPKLTGFNQAAASHWSSSRIQFVVDGGEYTRFKKLKMLVDTEPGRHQLKICTNPPTDEYLNCGRCVKCLRTMAALDMTGKLDTVTVFDRRYYPWAMADVEPVRAGPHDFMDLSQMAHAAGRRDLERLLNGYSRRYARKYETRRRRLEATLSESVMPARLARWVGKTMESGYLRLHKAPPVERPLESED